MLAHIIGAARGFAELAVVLRLRFVFNASKGITVLPPNSRAMLAAAFLIASANAIADESTCYGGTAECTGFGIGDMRYFVSETSCNVPSAAPPDPIGTFASRDGLSGNFSGSESGAAGLSYDAWKCIHPKGTTSPNGGVICDYGDMVPVGSPQEDHWTPTIVAGGSRLYGITIFVFDSNQKCTIAQTLFPFSILWGNRLECPAGMSKTSTSNGNSFICYRNRTCNDCEAGNPITIGGKEKRLVETDFVGGGGFPLKIVRYYGSQATTASLGEASVYPLGRGWRTQYHRSVSTYSAPLLTIVTLRRETGESRTFQLDSANNVLAQSPEKGFLERLTDGAGTLTGWRYRTPDEEIELYDANGRLTSITSRNGVTHSVAYDTSLRIATVTDTFGRQLQFHYNTAGRIDQITAPGGLVYAYTYTPGNGALETVTYPDQSVRRYLYEEPRLPWGVTGIVDERGIRISTYGYDLTTGNAKTTQLAGGVNNYTVTGTTLAFVTDPLGAVRNYQFTPVGSVPGYLLTDRTQPRIGGGYTDESYQYDANGNVSVRIDDEGNQMHYTFDLSRNLETQRIEAFGTQQARTTTTQWHATRRLPKKVAEPLRITTYSYHGETGVSCAPTTASTALMCSKTVQATTDANGAAGFSATADGAPRTTTYSYDANGQLLQVVGPRTDVADVATYTYSATGDLASMTNALGHVTLFTDYDAAGRLKRTVDPNGLETLLDYNARGWLKTRRVGSVASGYEQTTYDYELTGQLSTVTLPDGSYVQYTYDDAERLSDIRDGLGNHIHYTLDAMGNRTLEQAFDVQGTLVRSHSRVIDILNRVAQDIGGTNPSAQTTQNGYDAIGNLTSITDPLGRVTTQTFDALKRLSQMTDPFNGTNAPTKYGYNGRDQVSKVTDPTSLATTYVYNGHNELISQSSPDTGSTSFSYDASSNLRTKLDAHGVQATYSYDALNRLAQIVYPDETVLYTYDCPNNLGRLCSITDKSGTTTYGYDAKGRVNAKSQTTDGVTLTVGYDRNSAGQLRTVTLPSGHQVIYTYANNRPVSVAVDGQTVLDGVFYEPFGPNGGWRWGNSTQAAVNTHTRLFDKDFRATRVTSDLPAAGIQPLFDRQIGWDGQSRVQSLTDLANSSLNATYGYDALDRLASATQGASTWGFSYNGIGDRLTTTVNGASTTYGYFAATHRLQALSGAQTRSFGYDPAGNVATDTGTTWTYGGNNRPTQAGSTTFLINALGQRVKKVGAGGVTRFVYDESGRLAGEYDVNGAPIAETVWLEDLPVAVIK